MSMRIYYSDIPVPNYTTLNIQATGLSGTPIWYYKDVDGNIIPGLEIFDYYTEAILDRKKRCIGNIVIDVNLNGFNTKVIGFENHGGQTFNILKSFGQVLFGNGNKFGDSEEGYFDNNVIDYKYKDIISNNDIFIALNKKNKYGIIDKNNKVIVKFNNKVIDKFDSYYIFVNEYNKMALYDNNYKRITKYDMEYNTLIAYSLRNESNSINLYKVNGKIAIVNNYLENINGTEYDKHNLYIIDGNKIIKKINQIGFGYDNIMYTYDNKYNISIYNSDISLLYNIELNDVSRIEEISSVNNELIKVKYTDKDNKIKTLYYDHEGKEKEFKLGNFFLKGVEYRGYIKKKDNNKELTLYDLDNNKLSSVFGKNISIYDKYLIVDNSIYRIEIKEN